MISAGEIHPDSTELLSRDDFRRRNSSWFGGIARQGWFPAKKFILIWRNFCAGMISAGKMHPDLKKFLCRDDSQRGIASWFEEISVQRWFPAGEFILIRRNCSAGMISTGEIHPDSAELLGRDDSRRRNSSWFEEISVQGWFPPGKRPV